MIGTSIPVDKRRLSWQEKRVFFVTPQILGQGKIATFGTMAYQQASLVLDWPFASAIAVVMLAILGLGLAIGSFAAKRLARRPA